MTHLDNGFSAVVDRTPDEVSVAFDGELVMPTVDEASTILSAAITSACDARVVVDLSRVRMMDSSGLSMLLQTSIAMNDENETKLALRGITGVVARLFQIVNVDAAFDLEP